MTKQKFCKDCRFFYPVKWWDIKFYGSLSAWFWGMMEKRRKMCLHEKSLVVVSFVDGKTEWQSCREMRWDHRPCENEGLLFEYKSKDNNNENM
jgi:hypothetical protein